LPSLRWPPRWGATFASGLRIRFGLARANSRRATPSRFAPPVRSSRDSASRSRARTKPAKSSNSREETGSRSDRAREDLVAYYRTILGVHSLPEPRFFKRVAEGDDANQRESAPGDRC